MPFDDLITAIPKDIADKWMYLCKIRQANPILVLREALDKEIDLWEEKLQLRTRNPKKDGTTGK